MSLGSWILKAMRGSVRIAIATEKQLGTLSKQCIKFLYRKSVLEAKRVREYFRRSGPSPGVTIVNILVGTKLFFNVIPSLEKLGIRQGRRQSAQHSNQSMVFSDRTCRLSPLRQSLRRSTAVVLAQRSKSPPWQSVRWTVVRCYC
jgi:hypothetical protein